MSLFIRGDKERIKEYKDFAKGDGLEIAFFSEGEKWYEKYPTPILKMIVYLQQQSQQRDEIPQSELTKKMERSRTTVLGYIRMLEKDYVVRRGSINKRSKSVELLKTIPEGEFNILEEIIL